MKHNNKQAGSILIVSIMVLVVLGVITLISIRNLIASEAQVLKDTANLVMRNEVDVALGAAVMRLPSDTLASSMFTVARNNPGSEIVFCSTADMKNAYFPAAYNIYTWLTGTEMTRTNGTQGYCKPSDPSAFVYNRDIYLTQIAVRHEDHLNVEQFTQGAHITGRIYVITATSFLPKLTGSRVSTAAMETCLSSHMNDADGLRHSFGSPEARRSVAECLSDLGVPAVSGNRTVVIR